RADEEIAKAKGAQLASQVSENVERAYFALLIAQRHRLVAEKKVERSGRGAQLASTVAMSVGKAMESQTVLVEATKELVAADSEGRPWSRSLNAFIGFPTDKKLNLALTEPGSAVG